MRTFYNSSEQLLKQIIDVGLSGGSLLLIVVILFAKWLWCTVKDSGINFVNKKFTFHKKIFSILGVLKEDLKNIFYGLIGMSFTWTMVNLFFDILADFLGDMKQSSVSKEILLSQSQIEFANSINQSIYYLGLIEVIIIFMAFMMLSLSFLGGIFKTSAKILGAGAIIVAIGGLYIGHYAGMVSEIASKN